MGSGLQDTGMEVWVGGVQVLLVLDAVGVYKFWEAWVKMAVQGGSPKN